MKNEIKNAIKDVVKDRISYHNDGMMSSYRVSGYSREILRRENIKIEETDTRYKIIQNGNEIGFMRKEYGSKKINLAYREKLGKIEGVV